MWMDADKMSCVADVNGSGGSVPKIFMTYFRGFCVWYIICL